METIKPGTRCECCAEECPCDACHLFSQEDANAGITNQNEAVRTILGAHSWNPFKRVPVCAACAEYHEAKGA